MVSLLPHKQLTRCLWHRQKFWHFFIETGLQYDKIFKYFIIVRKTRRIKIWTSYSIRSLWQDLKKYFVLFNTSCRNFAVYKHLNVSFTNSRSGMANLECNDRNHSKALNSFKKVTFTIVIMQGVLWIYHFNNFSGLEWRLPMVGLGCRWRRAPAATLGKIHARDRRHCVRCGCWSQQRHHGGGTLGVGQDYEGNGWAVLQSAGQQEIPSAGGANSDSGIVHTCEMCCYH